MIENFLLSLILVLPLAGALLIVFLPNKSARAIKISGLVFSTLSFIASVWLFVEFDGANGGMQFVEKVSWIPSLDVSYHLGVDGISLLLVVLTTFLTPIALLASWESIKDRLKGFVALMLLLEVGTLGVFMSLDMFLFYVFWEFMLIPMYFIIGIWGGAERVYAAIKFFLYTMAGSLLMLVAIIWLGVYASSLAGGSFTTDLMKLTAIGPRIPIAIQSWMFLAFTLSFAIKVPIFPLHTWLPDAHVQAPTAGSVILAGVLLKMGTYGLVRFSIPLFPYATFTFLPVLAVLGVVGIIYGALVSMVQPDLKKLVAYSSVSHLGFVVLGIFALTEESMQGSVLQMINHGLSTGALFLLVGMIYDRRHTRMISDYGGIARTVPVFAAFFMIVALSSAGLPGLNGFIGEFLILVGSFKSQFLASTWYAILAGTGVIFAAVYLLWSYQRVFFGTVTNPENEKIVDLSLREWVVLVPVVVFIVWIGFYPATFLEKSAAASKQLIHQIEDARRGVQRPTAGQTPAPAQTPVEGQTPTAGQVSAAAQTPVAGQTPTAGQTPVAAQTPAPGQLLTGMPDAGSISPAAAR